MGYPRCSLPELHSGYFVTRPFASRRFPFYTVAMSTSNDLIPPIDELKTQASQVARKVGDQLNEQANTLRDVTAAARYNTQEFIENNPWQSIAMAAGIGFLVGVIISTRR